jgi:thiol:disulfide interchange protein DsbC
LKKSILFFLILLFLPAYCLGFETRGQDCSKCHTLTKEEATDLLKPLFQGIRALEVRISPTKGLWEVFSEVGGRKGILYVDFSKRYVFSGAILSMKEKRNLTQERFTDLTKVDVSQIPLEDAQVMGDPKARIRVIVFTDPDCPYCGRLHQEMKKITGERKDIAFYMIMYPLKIHPEAYKKAKAIVCEKSMELLEDAFNKKPLPEPKCETTSLDDQIKIAEKLGLSSTPTLILPDGRVVPGYKDAKTLLNLIGH